MNRLSTLVDLSFLIAAVVLVGVLLSDKNASVNSNATALEIQNLKQDSMNARLKNVAYLEGKINRTTESSDNFQISTNKRIRVLEVRMEMLEEKRDKNSQRIINNNTAISNK